MSPNTLLTKISMPETNQQNSICKSVIAPQTLASLASLLLLVECASSNPGRIPFAWTSDHRLSPSQRAAKVQAHPQAVFNALQTWVVDNGGVCTKASQNCPFTWEAQPDSQAQFREAQAIATKYWSGYDVGQGVKWSREDWANFFALTEAEFRKTTATNGGFSVQARMPERSKKCQYTEQVEPDTPNYFAYYNPGLNVSMPGRKGVHVAPSVTTIQTSVTPGKTVERTNWMYFRSILDFCIWSDGTNTCVYAVGTPEDVKASVRAAPNSTTGTYWWSEINGTQEASFILSAYAYIAKLDQAAQLEAFKDRQPPAAPAAAPAAPGVSLPLTGTGKEGLINVLKNHADADFYVAPNIPKSKLANARKSCEVPENDEVLALINSTVFGGAKNCLLVTTSGVFVRNDWAGKSPGRRSVPYKDFLNCELGTECSYEVAIGSVFFNTAGCSMSKRSVVALLEDVQRFFGRPAKPR
jgi:hypothetical protein